MVVAGTAHGGCGGSRWWAAPSRRAGGPRRLQTRGTIMPFNAAWQPMVGSRLAAVACCEATGAMPATWGDYPSTIAAAATALCFNPIFRRGRRTAHQFSPPGMANGGKAERPTSAHLLSAWHPMGGTIACACAVSAAVAPDGGYDRPRALCPPPLGATARRNRPAPRVTASHAERDRPPGGGFIPALGPVRSQVDGPLGAGAYGCPSLGAGILCG